jgi:hypothetical protein
MRHVRAVIALAARQHNRFSRQQLAALGVPRQTIEHRLASGLWVAVHDGVYAIAPVLDDDRGRWMAATLTARATYLSHASAGAAWGWWAWPRDIETVTRSGDGGPRRVDGLLVHQSKALTGDTTTRDGLPILCVPRTLLDLSPHVTPGRLARCVRDAIRLETTTSSEIMDALGRRHRGRRGSRRLALVTARYTGLPIHRARSGAEVLAMEILRDAGRPLPELNVRIGGEEADLTWRAERLIVELDGSPFHLDRGEDARKDAAWRAAGFTVRRLSADVPYEQPETLLALAPS